MSKVESDFRTAVVVRCHALSPKLTDLLRSLDDHDLFDLYVSPNETRGELDVGGYRKIPYTLQQARALGFSAPEELFLINCSDVLYEHLRRRIPDYDFYLLIEFDVDLVTSMAAFIDALVRKLIKYKDIDLIGPAASRRWPGWSHYDNANKHFAEVYAVFFPLVGLSRRAIEHLYETRLTIEPVDAPTEERIFCEAFVASALVAGGYRVVDLNELVPGSYTRRSCYWGLPMLFGLPLRYDPELELRHPVYSAMDFLRAHVHQATITRRLDAFLAGTEDLTLPISDEERAWACGVAREALATEAPLARPPSGRVVDTPILVLVDDEDGLVRHETGAQAAAAALVGGQPVVSHVLGSLAEQGFDDFTLCFGAATGPLGGFLDEALSEPARVSWGRAKVRRQTDEAGRGAAGRVRLAAQAFNRRVVVVHGNVLTDLDLRSVLDAHEKASKWATAVATQPPALSLALDGDIAEAIDEPLMFSTLYVPAGVLILEPEAFPLMQDGAPMYGAGLIRALREYNQLNIHIFEGFWHPLDSLRNIRAARHMWARGAPWRAPADTGASHG